MSLPLDSSLGKLNDCGCCTGLTAMTPLAVENRPGQNAIAYRVGTHSQFKQSLLSHLSNSQFPQLQNLRTREDDDFTIALFDGWATVADVLTFYQERIANESYLRTATERVSLLNLARLIGYELRSGVAANAYLAFELETAPGTPEQVAIDLGTKVQSLPLPGEQVQIFETVEKIAAKPEWNAIKPRLTKRHPIPKDVNWLFLAGISTGLKPGDPLLIQPDPDPDSEGESKPVFCEVLAVISQPENNRTKVELNRFAEIAIAPVKVSVIPPKILLPRSQLARTFDRQKVSAAELRALARKWHFHLPSIANNFAATEPPSPGVLTFRVRASIFGHNAPKWQNLPYIQRVGEKVSIKAANGTIKDDVVPGIYKNRQYSWAENTLDNYHEAEDNTIYLDNVYSSIVKDSYVVLKAGIKWKLHQVAAATEVSRSDFTLTAKVTSLTLNNTEAFSQFSIRKTTVFAQNEELKLAPMPIETEVSGAQIDLHEVVETLWKGQPIIICGELNENRGNQGCEFAKIIDVIHNFGEESYTQIILENNLDRSYVRDTVTIYANVALATHGETKTEVLGNGDGSQSYQRFMLRQSPLTYVSAANSSGATSTLQVRVNDILWHEVATLYGHRPSDRIYVTRTDDDGKTTIQFGDGEIGARLPSGQENIKATYRQGIGLSGMVQAGQLNLLMTRPLGVKGVKNPLPATLAQNPESSEEARRNATLNIMTLDRIVSLSDYEDFARTFSGIAKALATWVWIGEKRGIFVTLAGYNGEIVPEDSLVSQNLLEAMRKAGDPFIPLVVKSFVPISFGIAAKVKVDSDYIREKVLADVRTSLLSYFSFENRDLGQPVTKSEAIAFIQSIPGVVAVDLDKLYRFDRSEILNDFLLATVPEMGAGGALIPADLLTLDDDFLSLGELAEF